MAEMGLMLLFAGIHGALAVALGAFAAHVLEDRVLPQSLEWIQTGTHYQLIHAAALLGVAVILATVDDNTVRTLLLVAGYAFFAGAALFSLTLYLMAFGAPRLLGAVTPIGGVGMIAGWGVLVAAGILTMGRVS
ncbi:MAG: DUF423 domain-containing protein [Azospirillaceae bacterium]